MKCIDDRFNKEQGVGHQLFAKDKICQSGCPKNAGLEELYVSVELIFFFFWIPDP
jgi:hypothetical protein